MKNYIKPTIIIDESLTEGVYTASGSDCYTVTAKIAQTPSFDRNTYILQVDASHNAADNHHSQNQVLTITFPFPVRFVSCTGATATYVGSGNGNQVVVKYSYHNNGVENIGLGSLTISCDGDLGLVGTKYPATLTCDHSCDDNHSW